MRKKIGICVIALVVGFVLLPFCERTVFAQIQDVFDSQETDNVFLYKGDLISLQVYSLTRLAISVPGIVEIANADIDELLLVGQSVGETQLFIWDENGKKEIFVQVLPADLDVMKKRLTDFLASAGITTVKVEKNITARKLVLTGPVLSQHKTSFEAIIGKEFFGDMLLDLTVESGELIQIDVQISELSTTLNRELGIDWSTGADGLIFQYEEQLPSFDGSAGDWFKIGNFERTTAILATVSALIAEGEARILAKPSLVVTSGESANFLVGGEIPVRTTTTSTGGTSVQENVTYTSYGIEVEITPEIVGDQIKMDLTTSIRNIDASNAVGENVAFTTRSVDTKLLLYDGQTIVLAGLIQQQNAETTTGVPFLRRIPIVGMLFRSKNWPLDVDQEVVITVTPRRVTQQKITQETAIAKEQKAAGDQRASEAANPEEAIVDETAGVFNEADELLDTATEVDADVPAGEEGMTEGDAATPMEEANNEKGSTVPEEESAIQKVSLNEDVSQSLTAYIQAIQQKISRAISFPSEAKENGWSGTVVLSLVVLSDGTLNDVAVKTSSGQDVFDKDAVSTARILSPFPPFPSELKQEELVVTIPIIYSIEEEAGQGTETNDAL